MKYEDYDVTIEEIEDDFPTLRRHLNYENNVQEIASIQSDLRTLARGMSDLRWHSLSLPEDLQSQYAGGNDGDDESRQAQEGKQPPNKKQRTTGKKKKFGYVSQQVPVLERQKLLQEAGRKREKAMFKKNAKVYADINAANKAATAKERKEAMDTLDDDEFGGKLCRKETKIFKISRIIRSPCYIKYISHHSLQRARISICFYTLDHLLCYATCHKLLKVLCLVGLLPDGVMTAFPVPIA